MSETTTLKKVKREGARTLAVSIKPLQFVPGDTDGGDKAFACYVDSTGKEHRLPCTIQCARRIQGPKPMTAGSTHCLDGKLDKNFLVHTTNKAGHGVVATGVDVIPKSDLLRRQRDRDTEEPSYIEISVNTVTGDLDVTTMPSTVTNQLLMRLLAALDAADSITIGMIPVPGYVVSDIIGHKVRLELQ